MDLFSSLQEREPLMKAVYFNRWGAPEDVLRLGEFVLPDPAAGEVVVRLLASPLNPSDFQVIGRPCLDAPYFPQVAGGVGAGLVVRSGPGTNLEEGSLVSFRTRGAWAEYVVVPQDRLYVLPPDFPPQKAAQFSLNPVTAWALLEEARVSAGDWLLLSAGASALATTALQLAAQRGVRTISVVRREEDYAYVLSLGADVVIHTGWQDIAEGVREATGGKGAAAALDAVGGKVGSSLLQSLAEGGHLLLYGDLEGEATSCLNRDVLAKQLTVKGFGLDHWWRKAAPQTKERMTRELTGSLQEPSFQLPVQGVFPLADFREALAQFSLPGGRGKVLLTG